MPISVLVTGAGVVGRHLCEGLGCRGDRARALVHYSGRGDLARLEDVAREVRDEIETVLADITDPSAMLEVMRGREVLFDLGALVPIPYSYIAPQSSFIISTLDPVAESIPKLVAGSPACRNQSARHPIRSQRAPSSRFPANNARWPACGCFAEGPRAARSSRRYCGCVPHTGAGATALDLPRMGAAKSSAFCNMVASTASRRPRADAPPVGPHAHVRFARRTRRRAARTPQRHHRLASRGAAVARLHRTGVPPLEAPHRSVPPSAVGWDTPGRRQPGKGNVRALLRHDDPPGPPALHGISGGSLGELIDVFFGTRSTAFRPTTPGRPEEHDDY